MPEQTQTCGGGVLLYCEQVGLSNVHIPFGTSFDSIRSLHESLANRQSPLEHPN